MGKTYNSEYLGEVTKEQAREAYDSEPGIENDIREWLRFSDGEFAKEQMEELRGVIDFHVDAWDNVSGYPAICECDCGRMVDAVRNSIFGHPSTVDEAIAKLERYAEGVDRLGDWNLPEHFEKAIEEQMEVVCDEYAKCIKADFQWWMDAASDDLFENYFLDDMDNWVAKYPELYERRLEKIRRRKEARKSRKKRALRGRSRCFWGEAA